MKEESQIKISIGKEIDQKQWSNFILNHSEGNIFQSPEMYKVYSESKGMHPVALSICSRGRILGILLANVVTEVNIPFLPTTISSRCIINGGPLVVDKNKEHLTSILLKKLNSIIKGKVIFSEIRNFSKNKNLQTFSTSGYDFYDHLNILVDLDKSSEEILSSLSSSKRRYIRKSKKVQTISEVNNLDGVVNFYLHLSNFYKKSVRKPIPSESHFLSIFKNLNNLGMSKFFITKDSNNKQTGGIICLIYNQVIYEYYIYFDKSIRNNLSSYLTTWHAIDFGNSVNLVQFNFMGAGKPNEDYGVRDFKRGFGGREVNHGRFLKIYRSTLLKVVEIFFHIKQKVAV